MDENRENASQFKLVELRLANIDDDMKEIKQTLKGNYVTRDQFEPVKTIVYSMVGIVMMGVLGALMTLLFRGH